MPILQNRSYCILPTKQGVYAVVIRAREEEAQSTASLMYDGRDNALFLRRPAETIILDCINPTIQKSLFDSREVAIVELDIITEEVARTYKVPIRKVDEIFIASHGTRFSVC